MRQLHPLAAAGKRIVVLEPSCLSALRDDVPALLRGPAQRQAREVADACLLFEEWLEGALEDSDGRSLRAGDSVSYAAGSRHFSVAPGGCLIFVVLRARNRLLEQP